MKLNQQSTARLYAITAVACLIWLIQSLAQAHADGSLLTWPTLVFSLCLLIVTAYTGYRAVVDWKLPASNQAHQDETTLEQDQPDQAA